MITNHGSKSEDSISVINAGFYEATLHNINKRLLQRGCIHKISQFRKLAEFHDLEDLGKLLKKSHKYHIFQWFKILL